MSLAANKISEDALNILQTKGGLVLAAMVMKAQPKSKQSSPLIIEPEVKTVVYFHGDVNDLDTWQMHTSEVLARTTFDDITVRGIPKEKLLTSMKGRTFHEMQDHLHKQAN